MISTRLKLMAALTALVVLVVGVSGILAERSLRERLTTAVTESLGSRAALVVEMAAGTRFEPSATAELDALAGRAARGATARVTLIDLHGRVLGDSEVPLSKLEVIENHGDRPEVREALLGSVGQATRYSETVGRPLFYLAAPLADGSGVVRLAVDVSDLEASVAELRRELLVAGAVGLLAAVGLSYLLSSVTLRPIREVRRVLASIAGGELDRRLPLRWEDELGEISQATNQLAEQLRSRLEDATAEKERLQAVLDSMVEGVIVVDRGGRVVLANGRVREFYDTWTDVTGRTPLEAFRSVELDALIQKAAKSGESVAHELSVGSSSPRTLRLHAVRFPSGDGPGMGTVAVFHDVSEIARLEQVRRDFVANASHELRTPLTAIRGFAETLLASKGPADPELRSQLEIIDRHAGRLGNLVEDLLELSKLEAPGLESAAMAVDVAELARGLIRDNAPRFDEKEIRVESNVTGATVAWADPRALEQVLTNLIDNAVKYTEPGGTLQIGVEGVEGVVRVSVADSGIGIPEAALERVFERFFRVDQARSRALGGTGLGLAIVRHLVRNMGGEVTLESVLGEGSTFRFSLPPAP